MILFQQLNQVLRDSLSIPPEIIYHYTGASGLIGMLSNGEVWATKIGYLNDPMEERYGRDIISSCATEASGKTSDEEISHFLSRLSVNINDSKLPGYSVDFYVTSFSEKPDDLSQWICYGHDGYGYNVGMRVGDGGIDDQLLLPVIYDVDKQKAAVNKVLHLVVDYIEGHGSNPRNLNEAYSNVMNVLNVLIVCMKQPAYSHEKEWRLVYDTSLFPDSHSLGFREGNNQVVVPYLNFNPGMNVSNGDNLPIERIILGPQRDGVNESIKLLLKSKRYPNSIEIVNSGISYRS